MSISDALPLEAARPQSFSARPALQPRTPNISNIGQSAIRSWVIAHITLAPSAILDLTRTGF